jgi:D-aminoacyl-tRNA deacylase
MRALVQRVLSAAVTVDSQTVGQIDGGLLLLVGVTHSDTEAECRLLANKIANLRIFDDSDGNLNRSLLDRRIDDPGNASILLVSQFTLYADSRKGRRPSFTAAAAPALAAPLIDRIGAEFVALGVTVAHGAFGSHMAVSLVNDGPVTIWLDTENLRH